MSFLIMKINREKLIEEYLLIESWFGSPTNPKGIINTVIDILEANSTRYIEPEIKAPKLSIYPDDQAIPTSSKRSGKVTWSF